MQHRIPLGVQQNKPRNVIEIESKLNDLLNKNISDIDLIPITNSLKELRNQLINYAQTDARYAICINAYLTAILALMDQNTNSYLNIHLDYIKKSKFLFTPLLKDFLLSNETLNFSRYILGVLNLIKSYDQHINIAKQNNVDNKFIDIMNSFCNDLSKSDDYISDIRQVEIYPNFRLSRYYSLNIFSYIPNWLESNNQSLSEINKLTAWINTNNRFYPELTESLKEFLKNYITTVTSCLDNYCNYNITKLQNITAIIKDVNLSLSDSTLQVRSIHNNCKRVFVVDRLSERLEENAKSMNSKLVASILSVIANIMIITLAAVFLPISLVLLAPFSLGSLYGSFSWFRSYTADKLLLNKTDNMVNNLKLNFFPPKAPTAHLHHNEQKNEENVATMVIDK